jgi:wyosine [tRNA(Phe)-imidazoG37] synthetase (radical SAM superfamily)
VNTRPVKAFRYIYGPVPSRRLGLSLGVDIVLAKTCTLDCVYCQLGRTTEKTVDRRNFVDIEMVIAELKECLACGYRPDFITIGGSGEPTLNSQLGELIKSIRRITDIRVAILTNGTLLYRQDVRADCARADVVLPSLDAGDEDTFKRINRPHRDISIGKLISGLCAFRKEFNGEIWLEVFLVEGINTSPSQIAEIKNAIERICPDKVQLNTAVRPVTDVAIKKVDTGKLQAIAAKLGDRCEVVANLTLHRHGSYVENLAESLISMLKRRPCTLDDICAGLGVNKSEALKYIEYFQRMGMISSQKHGGATFFRVPS